MPRILPGPPLGKRRAAARCPREGRASSPRPASQETGRRMVALALAQGVARARCFPCERRTAAAGAASVRSGGLLMRLSAVPRRTVARAPSAPEEARPRRQARPTVARGAERRLSWRIVRPCGLRSPAAWRPPSRGPPRRAEAARLSPPLPGERTRAPGSAAQGPIARGPTPRSPMAHTPAPQGRITQGRITQAPAAQAVARRPRGSQPVQRRASCSAIRRAAST